MGELRPYRQNQKTGSEPTYQQYSLYLIFVKGGVGQFMNWSTTCHNPSVTLCTAILDIIFCDSLNTVIGDCVGKNMG